MKRASIVFITIGLVSTGVAWAQELPEVAVERSEALCGTDPQLPGIMRGVDRAILEHRLRTTGTAEAVVSGSLNVDIGDIAVLENRDDLVVQVLFVGGGKPRPGFVTDTTKIAQRFYTTHGDLYDAIVIFVGSTFPGNV